jgi:hypothetical protein
MHLHLHPLKLREKIRVASLGTGDESHGHGDCCQYRGILIFAFGLCDCRSMQEPQRYGAPASHSDRPRFVTVFFRHFSFSILPLLLVAVRWVTTKSQAGLSFFLGGHSIFRSQRIDRPGRGQ